MKFILGSTIAIQCILEAHFLGMLCTDEDKLLISRFIHFGKSGFIIPYFFLFRIVFMVHILLKYYKHDF